MIIDALISGGKHLAPSWTKAIKDEIENDYGSFVEVYNFEAIENMSGLSP